MVKGGSPVDPAAARVRAPRAAPGLRPVRRAGRGLARLRWRTRPGRAELIPPGVDTTLFTPPATGADARAAGPLRRPGRAHLALEGAARCWSSRWPGCASWCPDARLEVVGDGDDVPALQHAGRGARRRRPRRLDRPGRPPRAAGALPAGGRHRAALADRVGVVRDDAGRGDGVRLPGGRLGRGRHPVRGPRRRRRPARAARRARGPGAAPGRGADRPGPRGRARDGRPRGRRAPLGLDATRRSGRCASIEDAAARGRRGWRHEAASSRVGSRLADWVRAPRPAAVAAAGGRAADPVGLVAARRTRGRPGADAVPAREDPARGGPRRGCPRPTCADRPGAASCAGTPS